MELDSNKIFEYKNDLEHHNGLVPLALITFIDTSEYISYLRKKKKWDKIKKEIFNRRRKIQFMTRDEQLLFEDNELNMWIEDNPKFKDIIILV